MAAHSTVQESAVTIATVGLLLGLTGMLGGYGFSLLFPQLDVASYDWHVKSKLPVSVDPSIVIFTLDEQDPVSCGNRRWNSSIMASTITAMHKAGASVIAPAVRFEVPNPPECGDVLGNAQLLEATRQAGNVVYPSSIQPLFAEEARTTGWLMLNADDDGIFRGLLSKQMSNDFSHLPFGLAIASAYNNADSLELPDQGLVSFVGRWTAHPFPTHTFIELFNVIQRRDEAKLATLVQGKIVMMFPVTENSPKVATPLETAAPLGFVHANLLHTALTHSWLKKPSGKSWVLQTFGVVFLIALMGSWRRDIGGWAVVGIIITSYFGLNAMAFVATGTVWPYISSAIAIASTLIGIIVWPLYIKRKRIRAQIKDVGGKLAAMQENLAKKELLVEGLEDKLEEAKEHAEYASQKYQSLSTTEDETRKQLQKAETEAEDVRHRMEMLQHELNQLRKVQPAPNKVLPQLPDFEQQKLQKEAETFGIFTCSPALLKTFQELKKAAVTDSPILILGETGTGKELFARAVHRLSNRAQDPFVSVNMAAIRPELFESELFGHVKGAFTGAISRRGFLETADRGSVFLDEVGELPLDLQAKLLRVLESGEFYRVGQSSPTRIDIRIIAATNRDLSQAMETGQYREDLYYRLRSFIINLPPLRERGQEDINLLVERIMDDLSESKGREPVQVAQGALEAIQAYRWPGNVRELRQTLAQAVALSEKGILTEQDLRLPSAVRASVSLISNMTDVDSTRIGGKEEIAQREDEFVLSMLRKHGFDMQATAKALEWDRSTVTQRLKGLGFRSLVDHAGNVHEAAVELAGNASLVKIVELKLGEYYRNLLASTSRNATKELALSDCRKRMRNIPERHFPAIEVLIRQHFEKSTLKQKQN